MHEFAAKNTSPQRIKYKAISNPLIPSVIGRDQVGGLYNSCLGWGIDERVIELDGHWIGRGELHFGLWEGGEGEEGEECSCVGVVSYPRQCCVTVAVYDVICLWW